MDLEQGTYRSIIEIDRNLDKDRLSAITAMILKAFDNSAGRAMNISEDPYRFVFEGGEDMYGCISLGQLLLRDNDEVYNNISLWRWEEDDPDECCNVKKVFAKYRRPNGVPKADRLRP